MEDLTPPGQHGPLATPSASPKWVFCHLPSDPPTHPG